MKFMPQSSATWTARRASLTSTGRNSCPSDDAPKLSTGKVRPVFPSGRRSMTPPSIHAHADGQQQVGEALLVGCLDGQHVVRRGDRRVEIPLLDRLQLQLQPGGGEDAAELVQIGRAHV